VRDQLLLDDEKDDRITWAGAPFVLEPQSAMSFSMILHELGTNARKYGALSVLGGRLSLECAGKRCQSRAAMARARRAAGSRAAPAGFRHDTD
jgi:two-component sensor histidine kinase